MITPPDGIKTSPKAVIPPAPAEWESIPPEGIKAGSKAEIR